MAVMARETWTDERLDDLNTHVEKGFDEVKGEIRELRSEMNSRFDSNQRTMFIGFASIVASIVATQL